ncbi:Asp23/Gls24 family envelope stress response protein [Actinomadura graeca]|uniref:Asp23/Gls24 family envelope stress response protein n=1 Tax=Actinomadura graeca TaxID=2750812 RepID=A0ABX8QQA1_9ACTN|nr:Asp23/Gls24 family envelope stress response protein [Actinomadura graeca]QXJ20109.1 Asp23/Gls24 family envelope stress response protein [Actinomadura graeca]
MTDLDKGGAATGGEPQAEAGPQPYFPGPPGLSGPPTPSGTPLSAPPPASPGLSLPGVTLPGTSPHSPATHGPPTPGPVTHDPSSHSPSSHTLSPPVTPTPHAPVSPAVPLHGGGPSAGERTAEAQAGGDGAPVDGRITIEDEVIEKIATLAALEVPGVVGLAGRPGPDERRGAGGVRVRLHGDEVTLDLGIAVGYGNVIMEVARVVKSNVARVAGLMLGMRVVAVNVAVEDVRVTAEAPPLPGTAAH